MTEGLALQGISMHFGSTQALAGLDLQVDGGRYAVLLGPSGCGKSTLLAILGGFLEPSIGRVLIGGRS
jgi:ABC-type sugar transport system ATPase subunit